MNKLKIRQALQEIDIIIGKGGLNERAIGKAREFIDFMIAHAMSDGKINVETIGTKKVVSVPEGKLYYDITLDNLKIHITQKIKEKMK